MSKVIAKIRLAPGNVGYYDDLSKVYLTLSRPEAVVYDYMNTTRLIKSIKSKTLILVAGSLNTSLLTTEAYAINEDVKMKISTESVELKEEPEIVVQPIDQEVEVIEQEAEIIEEAQVTEKPEETEAKINKRRQKGKKEEA